MHTRTTIDSQTVADFVDQVAALDDAPDRTRCAWFYADLARLAADAIDDYVTSEPDDKRHRDAYQRGHDAGYRRGCDDARRRTRPTTAGTGRHRTANRRQRRRGGSA